MSELGARLRGAREEQGLTIEDISRTTKIQSRHLKAIEAGEWSKLPEPVYTRAFIRHMAYCVNMDPDEAVALYARESGTAPSPVPAVAEIAATRSSAAAGRGVSPSRDAGKAGMDTTSAHRVQRRRRKRRSLGTQWAYVGLFFLLVVGIVVGYRNQVAKRASIDGLNTVGGPTTVAERPQDPFGLSDLPPVETVQVFPTATSSVGNDDRVTVDPLRRDTEATEALSNESMPPAPAATAELTPPSGENVSPSSNEIAPAPATIGAVLLGVEVEQDSWMEARADGDRIYVGILTAGARVEWEAEEELTVTFGRPEGVYLTLNGHDIGVAGTGVITRRFTPADVPTD